MTGRAAFRSSAIAAALCAALLPVTACHSYHIDSTIENRTGADIQLLEVDYPGPALAQTASLPARNTAIASPVLGTGPLKITYTAAGNKQVQITGPTLEYHQQGQLKIVLLPAGKAQFVPKLTLPS